MLVLGFSLSHGIQQQLGGGAPHAGRCRRSSAIHNWATSPGLTAHFPPVLFASVRSWIQIIATGSRQGWQDWGERRKQARASEKRAGTGRSSHAADACLPRGGDEHSCCKIQHALHSGSQPLQRTACLELRVPVMQRILKCRGLHCMAWSRSRACCCGCYCCCCPQCCCCIRCRRSLPASSEVFSFPQSSRSELSIARCSVTDRSVAP